MNKNLLKTLLLTAIFAMGASSLWADDEEEVEYQLLKTIDFEDADTYTSGWTINSACSYSQQTLSDDTHFIQIYQGGGSGNRQNYYTISETSFLSATQWKLEYSFACTASNTNASTFTVQDASGSTIFYISQGSYSATGTVYNASDESLGTITLEAYTKTTPTVWVTVILTGSEDGVNLAIYNSSGEASISETQVSETNQVPKTLDFTLGRAQPYLGVDDIKMYIVSDEEIVSTPTASITGVNGTSRTITMSCETEGATIRYSESGDLSDPTEYSDPITIEETKTLYIYATTETGGISGTDTCTFEAGTEISVELEVSVTAMTETDGVYYPTYSYVSDNSDVLCSPTATITITKDEETVEEISEEGTYVVTASAEGYTSVSQTIEYVAYCLYKTPSTDYDEINSTNIESVLGDGFTLYSYPEVSSEYTRFPSWNTSGGYDADGTANSGSQYYFYRSSDTSITLDDYAVYGNSYGVELVVGYGFGSGNRTTSISIVDAANNSIAYYYTCGYGSSNYDNYVTTINDEDLAYTVPRYYTLRSASYYIPVEEKSIPATGYASFSSEYNVTVPEGVTVYIATACDGEYVTLSAVDVDIIPANTGVILEGSDGDYVLTPTTDDADEISDENLLIASSEYPTVGEDGDGYTYYGLNATNTTTAEFAVIATGTELSGNKAYLGIEGSSEAKTLKITFGSTTGISEAAVESASSDGAIYSLQGIKVSSPSKGLYIQDGKKVIIK